MKYFLENKFSLGGKVALITGGAGLLGFEHAAAISGCDGIPVLVDIDHDGLDRNAKKLKDEFDVEAMVYKCDVTNVLALKEIARDLESRRSFVSVLINNAARNPVVSKTDSLNFSRLENFPQDQWDLDIAVGLSGAFNCCKIFGSLMAASGVGGVIVNIASDLGVIAPDQRLYRVAGVAEDMQPVKPVSYSVVKHGLIGLTKYVSTYWAEQGVRCNSLSPGGVLTDQSEEFVTRISRLIPLGRMAHKDEYRGAIAFLCSDASSYMNGTNIVMDGGRSVW